MCREFLYTNQVYGLHVHITKKANGTHQNLTHRFGSYRSLRKGTASACLFTFTADAQLLCSEVRDCSEKTYESHIGFNNSIGQLEKKPLKSSAPIKTSSTESLKEVQLSTGNDLWRHRLFDPPQFPGVQHLNPHAAPA
jgi:hypothetical protein